MNRIEELIVQKYPYQLEEILTQIEVMKQDIIESILIELNII